MLALFQQLLPVQVFVAALAQAKVREHNRVYNSAVVVWLMISLCLSQLGGIFCATEVCSEGAPLLSEQTAKNDKSVLRIGRHVTLDMWR